MQSIHFKIVFIILLLSTQIGCGHFVKSNTKPLCIQNRATLDMGSGSTKVLAAKVDLCKKQILEVYLNAWESLKFKESLKDNNNQIPEKLITKAILKLVSWKKDLKQWDIHSYTGVATEVFRQAQNGQEALRKISTKTNASILLIDQNTEAELGFWAAVANLNVNPKDIIVWDIGGGSMQITTMPNNTLDKYLGKMASVSFKDEVLKLKKTNTKSPNPMGVPVAKKAVDLAYDFAKNNLPKKLLSKELNKTVVGIGGVHAKSILNQTHTKDSYDLKDLEKLLVKRANFNDSMIGGQYPETEVTNIALIIGFMKAMNIEHVIVSDVNLNQGLILQD